jgi:uncharacterized protein
MDSLKRLSNAFVTFITHKPWLSMLVAFAMLGAIFTGFPKMTANFTHTAFFEADDPELVRFNAFERKFGNDDAVVIAVYSPSGVFDEETANLLRELDDRMWQVPEVIRVESLASFKWVHAQGDDIEIEDLLPHDQPLTPELLAERKRIALEHELLPGYLVSKDGTSAMVYAHIKPGIDKPSDAPAITAATKKIVAEMTKGDHQFYLLGGPIMTDAFREVSQTDLSKLIPMLLGMVIFLLVLTFRKVSGVVLPMLVIFPTIAAALALSGHLGFEMSSVTLTLPQVLIAVCIADAVHLVATFYRARAAGHTRRDAAHHTLQKNLVPTWLTSVTTALGFVSFATAHLRPIEYFGILAALGTMLAWFVTYLLVGPMMVLWPGKDDVAPALKIETDDLMASTPRSRAYIGFIARHRTAIMVAFGVITVGSGVLASRNIVNSNPYEYFARDVPVRQAQDFALEHLDGIAGFEIVVESGREDGVKDPAFLRKVEQFEKRVLEIDGVNKAVSIVDILRQMNRALNGGDPKEYRLPETAQGIGQQLLLYTMGLPQGMDVNDRITVKNDAMRISIVTNIVDSSFAMATRERMQAIGKELGLNLHVTGKIMLYQSMNGHVVQSFLTSLLLAFALIGTVMLVSFRSVTQGLVSMIPNVVPLAAGGAVLYFLNGALDIGTVLVASVSLGIAVDNTIHIFSSWNRHVLAGDSPTLALEKLFAHTGPAMLSTTLILILGFLTLALGSFIPNVYFGLLTAIILGMGMIADFVLLPALLLTISAPQAATAASPQSAVQPAA